MEQSSHPFLFWDFKGYGGQTAVRMGDWKGIRRNQIKDPDSPIELYDLRKDIGENTNVASEFPEIAEKIKKLMLRERTIPSVEMFRFGTYADTGPSPK
jgi:arylsulfatase A